MKILMDADCLIKLTKAGLKEPVCRHFEIVIPEAVKREVVDAGRLKGLWDAETTERNILDGLLGVSNEPMAGGIKGDQALFEGYQKGGYDFVATDDARMLRLFRSSGIPSLVPGLFIFLLWKRKTVNLDTALRYLDRLSVFVSPDEESVVRLLLEGKR
jgi:hypothetical protein